MPPHTPVFCLACRKKNFKWIPACAGMTTIESCFDMSQADDILSVIARNAVTKQSLLFFKGEIATPAN
jgi:hypothetical protein